MGSKIFIFLFLLVLGGPFQIFSQSKFTKEVIEPLTKDALFREKVFIQLNKSVYFTNDNIWFKAYVAEENNKPSEYTTNLLVNLLDVKGDVVDHKEVFVNQGMARGDFYIDDNLRSGTYFIHGFTNFMQNFGPKNVFLQKIEIINPLDKEAISPFVTSNDHVVRFFPEGGQLLEGVNNTMGIKVTNQLRGNTFHGKIIDSKGTEITTFKGNRFGMGKCRFFYERDASYMALISINETIQKYKVPKAEKTGLILSIDNTDKNTIKLVLSTNTETLPRLKNDKLAILFYRNNTLYEAANLSLENAQETTQELFFDKTKMLTGVNSVTLLKDNKPIATRKFFVDKPSGETAVMIERVNIENDSILFKIQTMGPDYKPVPAQLSVSILPEETKSFREHQNIKSDLLLSPYLKGYIEDPAYYFRNMDENEKEYLDILLLNQEVTDYTLEGMISKINPVEKFQFDNGFTLHGTIKRPPKGYDLGILSKENKLVTFSRINEKNEFLFKGIFTYRNDGIKMTLLRKNEPLVRPEGLTFYEQKAKTANYGFLTTAFGQDQVRMNGSQSTTEANGYANMMEYPNTEVLEEVVVQGVKARKNEKSIFDVEMALAKKHKVVSSWAYTGKKVTEQLETIHETVFDYFWHLGHIKPSTSDKMAAYSITLRSTPATLMNLSNTANSDSSFPPKIYIDDALINRDDNIETLRELSMRHVDEILINKSGAGGGVDGTGGMIRIYLKKGDHQYFDAGSKNLYETVSIPMGFDRPKVYTRPQYAIRSKGAFNWTEIDWKPSVKTNEEGEAFIKVPQNKFSNEFHFIVNGFSNNGLLFHSNLITQQIGF